MNNWVFLLAFPMVPALLGIFFLLIFVPESPQALIRKNDEKATRHGRRKNSDVVLGKFYSRRYIGLIFLFLIYSPDHT
jgi:hypothetical protein